MQNSLKKDYILNNLTMRAVLNMYCPELQSLVNNPSYTRIPCPLHTGANNNFQIYDKTNTFYCWKCGMGGDVIKFVADLFDITYGQAINRIANDIGIGTNRKMDDEELARLKAEIKKRNEINDKIRQVEKQEEKELQKVYAELDDAKFMFFLLQRAKQLCKPTIDKYGEIDFSQAENYAWVSQELAIQTELCERLEDKLSFVKDKYKAIKDVIRTGEEFDKKRKRSRPYQSPTGQKIQRSGSR